MVAYDASEMYACIGAWNLEAGKHIVHLIVLRNTWEISRVH